jgi:hypothetical protein
MNAARAVQMVDLTKKSTYEPVYGSSDQIFFSRFSDKTGENKKKEVFLSIASYMSIQHTLAVHLKKNIVGCPCVPQIQKPLPLSHININQP